MPGSIPRIRGDSRALEGASAGLPSEDLKRAAGCTAPGYWCEAHHVHGWTADHGPTDITTLTLACPTDNKLIEKNRWRTRKRRDGRTQWLPPPNLDTGQTRVNNFHHPHRYLIPDENAADEDEDGP